MQAALSQMGREPFQRLCRAVRRTETPLASDDEGGNGPGGATSSMASRLDPADNVANQVTAPGEANINNLDVSFATDSFLAAVASPTSSQATQDPVWPPAASPRWSPICSPPTSWKPPSRWRPYFLLGAYGHRDLYASHGAYYIGRGYRPIGRSTALTGRSFNARGAAHSGCDPLSANKIAPERVREEPVLPTATGADQLGGSSRPSKPGVPRKQPGLLLEGAQKGLRPSGHPWRWASGSLAPRSPAEVGVVAQLLQEVEQEGTCVGVFLSGVDRLRCGPATPMLSWQASIAL